MNMPKFIMLIGIPGSGKTTYAKEHIEKNTNTIHLSSDKIREELWGDEATQGDNNEVFTLMQNRTIEALNNGQTVIYDATNITRKDRSYIISLCPKFVQVEAHIIWAPIETCIERDTARERTVGKAVIDKMLKRFQPPFYDEGFDEIKIIKPNEFDSANYSINILNKLHISHDNPHHRLSVKEHCADAEAYCWNKYPEISALQEAAAYHDIGKPMTKMFKADEEDNTSPTAYHYQHDNVGGYLVYGCYASDPVSKCRALLVSWLVCYHMHPYFQSNYYNNLTGTSRMWLDMLHEADVAAH